MPSENDESIKSIFWELPAKLMFEYERNQYSCLTRNKNLAMVVYCVPFIEFFSCTLCLDDNQINNVSLFGPFWVGHSCRKLVSRLVDVLVTLVHENIMPACPSLWCWVLYLVFSRHLREKSGRGSVQFFRWKACIWHTSKDLASNLSQEEVTNLEGSFCP